MKSNSKLMKKWIKQYFNLVYHYACFICNDRSQVDRVVDRTFNSMSENTLKLKNKNPDEIKEWVLQMTRYYILKEIYDSLEQGENISSKYNSPDTLDPERIRKLIKQYEEMR
ncbi:MAG: hypothetical protein PUG60_02765 [Lachnospiraceae bacterium]|nr:hypothetical protein [Lachnospiraceae bacterium]MDY4971793.1 hypothetical protein [Lachnospiraceae bacterium]